MGECIFGLSEKQEEELSGERGRELRGGNSGRLFGIFVKSSSTWDF